MSVILNTNTWMQKVYTSTELYVLLIDSAIPLAHNCRGHCRIELRIATSDLNVIALLSPYTIAQCMKDLPGWVTFVTCCRTLFRDSNFLRVHTYAPTLPPPSVVYVCLLLCPKRWLWSMGYPLYLELPRILIYGVDRRSPYHSNCHPSNEIKTHSLSCQPFH